MAALTAFYSINDIQLNRRKLGKFVGEKVKVIKDRAYTFEEIHKMLDVADTRGRALILLLTSTGMRIGALPAIRLGSLQKIQEYNIYKVTVYEGSSDESICFTTPECATAIDFYLQQRERRGERLRYHSDKGIWTPEDTTLFRKEYNKNDPFQVPHARPLSKPGLDYLLQQILEKAGIITITPRLAGKKTGPRREVARSNGFRKMVNTAMVKCKVEPLIKEMLLGHHIGLEESYYRPAEEDLLREYLKCIDYLTVNEENRLKKQVETLLIEKSEIQELRHSLNTLREQFNRQIAS